MKKNLKTICPVLFVYAGLFAQDDVTLHKTYTTLDSVTISTRWATQEVQSLPDIMGTQINAGKKTTFLNMDKVAGNIIQNNARELFAKVPGISILQRGHMILDIGTRGLNPSSGQYLNMRQDGYDIGSDTYLYADNYYTPPLNFVQGIEIYRGSSALQYGNQYGGMINYIMYKGSDIIQPLAVKARATGGSYGLAQTMASVGGSYKKWSYLAMYDFTRSDGFKLNSLRSHGAFANVSFRPTKKLTISAEYSFKNQLTKGVSAMSVSQEEYDHKNIRGVNDPRSWFYTNFQIMGASLDWKINSHQTLQAKVFGKIAQRINLNAGGKENADSARQLTDGRFNSIGGEVKYLHEFYIANNKQVFTAGTRIYDGNYKFYQQNGKLGSSFDASLDFNSNSINPLRNQDMHATSYAAYVEQLFSLFKNKLYITPAIRYEYIFTRTGGINQNGIDIPPSFIDRHIPLFGVSMQYNITDNIKIYGGFNQAYRTLMFFNILQDTLPGGAVTDPNIKDSKGYQGELGIKGNVGQFLSGEITGFYMFLGNRPGSITNGSREFVNTYNNGQAYRVNLQTNVGNGRSAGVEALVNFSIFEVWQHHKNMGNLDWFINFSYVDSRYISGQNKNNQVENVSPLTMRTGVEYRYSQGNHELSLRYMYSFVKSYFTNANNSTTIVANGSTGKVPSYMLHDIFGSYGIRIKEYKITLQAGVNNIFNTLYMTTRTAAVNGRGIQVGEPAKAYISILFNWH